MRGLISIRMDPRNASTSIGFQLHGDWHIYTDRHAHAEGKDSVDGSLLSSIPLVAGSTRISSFRAHDAAERRFFRFKQEGTLRELAMPSILRWCL